MNDKEKQQYIDDLIAGELSHQEKTRLSVFQKINPQEWNQVLKGDLSVFSKFDYDDWFIFFSVLESPILPHYAVRDCRNYKRAMQWIEDVIPYEHPKIKIPTTVENIKELGDIYQDSLDFDDNINWALEEFIKRKTEEE